MLVTHSSVQFEIPACPEYFGPGWESEKKQHTVAKKGNGKLDTIEGTFDPWWGGRLPLWVQTINVKVTLPIAHLL